MTNYTTTVERTIKLISQPQVQSRSYIQEIYAKAGASDGALSALEAASDAAYLVTFAGRGCYRSFDVPNEATDTPQKYLRQVAKHRHWSVFEHASFGFHIDNVSRAATHELVRHRHHSFSQESQRYVTDKRGREIVLPPAIEPGSPGHGLLVVEADAAFQARDQILKNLSGEGLSRKQAAEAARAVVPNSAATSLVMSGNARSWFEFISKRHHPAADAELQQIAESILSELEIAFPEAFADLDVVSAWSNENWQEEAKH